jgi:subtilisin family serine protease
MIARRAAVFGVGVAALVLLVVATPLFGAGREEARSGSFGSRTQSFTGSQRSHQLVSRAATKSSAGTTRSFYYYNGKPVWLERSQSELSVRFSAQASRTDRKKLDLGLATSTPRRASQLRGRELSRVSLKRGSNAAMGRSLTRLRARRNVDFAYPVWIDSKRGGRLLLTDEVIVRLKQDRASAPVREMLKARGLSIAREIAAGSGVFVLRLSEPKKADPLAVSRALYRSGLVDWAEPNFVQELQKDYLANDPLFAEQWYLNNSGQNGGTVGADARLAGAWDLEKGSRAITIAVIDDGVQLSHPDLAPNIYTNRREIPGNGIDDDLNGFPDDVHGWNFLYNNKNVNPSGDDEDGDNHGTAVAGVAAARGDNSAGISGACPNCTILPVKISDEGDWADDSSIASAIVYAGTMADVLSISWGGSESSAVIEFALQYANTIGRDEKGAVIVASSGNAGSGYFHYTLEGLPPDTYRFRWVYSKDFDDLFDAGADTAWLAWVRFPDGEIRNFEQGGSGLPSGWLTGGSAPWSLVNDPEHADEGRCWSHAAKAGKISNDQQTYIELVKTLPVGGKIDFLAFVSSEMGVYGGINGGTGTWPLDGLRLWVDKGDDGSWEWADEGDLYAGVPPTGLVYPAAFPQPIAVGASTSFDCRAAYSQFGPELDLVVPSSGGGLSNAVVTTDRTGAAGYSPGDYFSDFGGTSSAAPLAAGVVGLILSRNPGLTATRVREILESSADKVSRELGGYDASGHSDRYGYGRIDAQRALRSTPTPSTISFTRAGYRVREGRAAAVRIRRSGNTALAATVRFATLGRTAKSVRDFRIVTRKVRFAPGQRLEVVAVPTVDDDVHEPAEQLYLKLSMPSSGAVLRTPRGSRLTIIDSDRRFGKLGSASLSQTAFEPEQARSVRLSYRFTRPCGTFRYVLSRNEGGKWKALRGSRSVGDFVGTHTLTAKTLFARAPIASGQYRVRLFADTNSKRLVFTIR